MIDHGPQHRKWRAAKRAAVQIDPIRRQQPLPAKLSPVAIGIGLCKLARWQSRWFLAEGFLRTSERQTKDGRGHGTTANEVATIEHGAGSHRWRFGNLSDAGLSY